MTAHILTCEDQETKRKRINVSLPDDEVVWPFLGFKMAALLLTEGSIVIANTGAATNTILINESASLFSKAHNAMFSATLQNEVKEAQAFLGLIFNIDYSTIDPVDDTAIGLKRLAIDLGRKSGAVRTYSEKSITESQHYEFVGRDVVEASPVKPLPYCGSFLFDFYKPVIVKRTSSIVEYISYHGVLYASTEAAPLTPVAHTTVTTYTFPMNAYAILADVELVDLFSTMDEFWNQFRKGG